MLNTHSCGARWGGAGRSHCAGCHETFSSDSAWTRHRRGLACRDPRDAGLVAADNPHGGVIWQRPGTWQPTDPATRSSTTTAGPAYPPMTSSPQPDCSTTS